MSLLAELKRRNVLRMAGLYLVGAWLVVQVAATVLPLFGAPEWLARSVVVLLAIGFLPALAFAWVFEWTPEGLRRDAELGPAGSTAPRTARRMDRMILVVLALALAAFAAARLLPSSRDAATPEGGPATAAVAAKAAHPKSIAVLPFANLSDDKANEYFVSGMQDMILTKLSEVRELRVASRTSTERYADHRGSVRDIAAELGVAHVLEGSVQKAGNRVLINLQLIDGRNDEHLWARAYERTLDDIFGVEGEVAKLVAEALHAELSVAEAAAVASVTTHDKEAYDRLLRSRFFLNQSNRSFDPADLDRSIELAREAVALDPGYVDGWALLSLAHVKRRGPDAAEEAEASARRVLALDPDHARGHLHLGFALALRGRHEEAIAEAREAARLRPDKSNIQSGLAITLAGAGRYEEAKAPMAAAVALWPESNFARNWQANLHLALREYAAARELARSALQRDPADLFAASVLVDAQLLGFGDIDGARKTLQALPLRTTESSTVAQLAARVEAWARDYAAARSLVEQATAGSVMFGGNYSRGLELAPILQALGDTGAARAAYAQARDELQARIPTGPDDALLHAALARALSGLGEHAEATRIAEAAATMPTQYVLDQEQARLALAEVHMRAGRADDAVAGLRELMRASAGGVLSVHALRLDPTWDALRGTPAFAALLQELE